ncbi:MAG: element excision factor XisH family protein [Chloroflexi bacterium]|nr:element excision factor XisH family protein [Chloroflexota bacterium]
MANDTIHDAIVQALKHDGWHILREHFSVRYEELEIRVDIVAERPAAVLAEKDGHRILVKIKTFGGRSFIKDLQNAVGQYTIYKNILALADLDYELFLAIHESIYEVAFQQKATSAIVQLNQLKLLVVNIDSQEIVKWIE